MPAGTITLTNGSTAVTGSGTAFTTDLAVSGFIVATVGGTAYTLGISAITSNTALTLTQAYTGPTTSGVSFDYVPLATLNLITSALASQVTYAVRGMNLDKANWQQIFSGTGTVTVTLPDGTNWTGPAWNGITTTLSAKADKSSNLSDLSNLSTAWANLFAARTRLTALSDLGFTGASSGFRAVIATPSGKMMIQVYNSVSTPDSSGNIAKTFDVAFSSAPLVFAVNGDAAASFVDISNINTNLLATSCTLRCRNPSTGAAVTSSLRWFLLAIGPVA
ncbi:MAG: hypothetical protein QM578_09235 [Pantoea sp.]|uniref:hypothetical protein n=1 Tax=Pantoea sp. TaxID=69393 RepID=UPI0039E4C365